jgi:cyanophycin synthetase
MDIIDRRVFRGPNLYARFRVIRLTVELGPLEDHPSGSIAGFNEKILQWMPSLAEHGCSYGEPGGFVRRLGEDGGTWMGHILEHMAIELQRLTGADISFGKTRGTGRDGQYDVVFSYEEERVGLAAADLALQMIHQAIPEALCGGATVQSEFNFEEELDDLITFAQRRQFGPSTASLVRAAEQRDIPWLRLNDYSLIQFGHGKFQKRIQATITSETRHIAVEIASDKEETNALLNAIGLPVPRQRLVQSVKGALRAIETLGYPVAIKPYNANHGRGVSLDINTTDDVETAIAKAKEHGRSVLVEQMIEGFDHRMLVVDGELVAVSKRVPGHVVGDGQRSISELIDQVNEDPRRGVGHEKVLTRIDLDHQARRLLSEAGHDPDTVLDEGVLFYLRSTGNLSTGGTAIDLTDAVHPENREMARRAARTIGLDVAGIDFITPDITRSYREVGGAVCEINAAPGFRMHVAPTEGKPRDVAGPVMDMLFPPESPTRIPIAALTGTNGKTTTARMLAHILKMSGATVGLTTTDGVYIDGERTASGDMTGPHSAHMVLRDPKVDTAVFETARGGLLRSGLGYLSCNVGAVLNVANDHLGLKGIDTVEQLAQVKQILVEVARDCAVLNADDLLCLKMAAHTQAKRIAYFTMNPKNPLVLRHIEAGGLAIVLEQGIKGQMITIYDEGMDLPLLWTHLVPATMEGKALHNVQNAMAASLMAYAMGIRADNIRQALRTFDTSFFQVPGRMNVYDEHPFKVILDYAHNPAAVLAMVGLVARLGVEGRRICVASAPGDRRDQDICEIARNLTAGGFDHIILRRDDGARGRGHDEVPMLMRDELLTCGMDESQLSVIIDEQEAVTAGLDMARRGDLLVIFGDAPTRCWKQIITYKADEATAGSAPLDDRLEPALLAEFSTPNGIDISEFESLIIDERGARLAAEESD